jgi:hypothetical protein
MFSPEITFWHKMASSLCVLTAPMFVKNTLRNFFSVSHKDAPDFPLLWEWEKVPRFLSRYFLL